MDKKITGRIIGAIVMIALVIIVLPLVLNGMSTTAAPLQAAEIKAPPFPEPQNETDPISTTYLTTDSETISSKESRNTSSAFPVTPIVSTALEAKDAIEKAQNMVTIADQANKTGSADKISQPENIIIINADGSGVQMLDNTPETAPIKQIAANNTPKIIKKPRKVAMKQLKIPTHIATSIISNNLSNLKRVAWVVEMGSFRNKKNAIHLTNILRAKGYKAFTYETKSNGQTRVYVGPEFKQASVSTLANRIQQEVNMRGVVVAYQPLQL